MRKIIIHKRLLEGLLSFEDLERVINDKKGVEVLLSLEDY